MYVCMYICIQNLKLARPFKTSQSIKILKLFKLFTYYRQVQEFIFSNRSSYSHITNISKNSNFQTGQALTYYKHS